jgi:hypothetical protein
MAFDTTGNVLMISTVDARQKAAFMAFHETFHSLDVIYRCFMFMSPVKVEGSSTQAKNLSLADGFTRKRHKPSSLVIEINATFFAFPQISFHRSVPSRARRSR